MSPELIGIITVGIGLFSANLALTGFVILLLHQSESRTNLRIDRLEERMDREFEQLRAEMNHGQDETNRGFEQLRAEMNHGQDETNRGFEQLRAEMNQGFAQQDDRIRRLEQGQAYMSGQFSELKDYFMHRPAAGNNPEAEN